MADISDIYKGTTPAVSGTPILVTIPEDVVSMEICYIDTNLMINATNVFAAVSDYATITSAIISFIIESEDLGGRTFYLKGAGAGSASIIYTKRITI
jgi:hypothetical protein